MLFSPPADIFGVDGVIILVVVLVVLFGGTQIPKLARSLGSAQKEFKKGLDEGGAGDPNAGAVHQAAPTAGRRRAATRRREPTAAALGHPTRRGQAEHAVCLIAP